MTALAIPESSRSAVKAREGMRCLRCGSPRGAEWHHRRSRRVRDAHQHCPCVGVWLCVTCHRWAHTNPREARAEGFIVSQYESEPWTVPVRAHFGMLLMNCKGTYTYCKSQGSDPLNTGEGR